MQTLADLLDQFQEWRDKLPSSLASGATAEALDGVLELRGHVEDLQAVELPKGFGRGLTTLIDGATGRASAKRTGLASSWAVHIRLLECEALRTIRK